MTRDKEEKTLRDALLRHRLKEIVELAESAPLYGVSREEAVRRGRRKGGGEVRAGGGREEVSDTRADEQDVIEHLSGGRKLRLVPSPEVRRPCPKPEPRLKELLEGLSRRRPMGTSEDDAPDAA